MVRFLLAFTALSLVSGAALAGNAHTPRLSQDRRMTMATGPAGRFLRSPPPAAGATLVAGNLGTYYPNGAYFPIEGYTISGATSAVGEQVFLAVPFTPTTTTIYAGARVGVGYVEGADGVSIALYSDNGGLPGTELDGRSAVNLPVFGGCCGIASAAAKNTVTLTAGTQYWLVVSTASTGWEAWNLNTTDEVDTVGIAVNEGAGWVPSSAYPGPAFAVYGR